MSGVILDELYLTLNSDPWRTIPYAKLSSLPFVLTRLWLHLSLAAVYTVLYIPLTLAIQINATNYRISSWTDTKRCPDFYSLQWPSYGMDNQEFTVPPPTRRHTYRLLGHLASIQKVSGVFPPGEIHQRVRLNMYLLLVSRLRIRGAFPPPSLISQCRCARAHGEIRLYLYFWKYNFPQHKGKCSSLSANHLTVTVETVL
jgi:hypothetical protein